MLFPKASTNDLKHSKSSFFFFIYQSFIKRLLNSQTIFFYFLLPKASTNDPLTPKILLLFLSYFPKLHRITFKYTKLSFFSYLISQSFTDRPFKHPKLSFLSFTSPKASLKTLKRSKSSPYLISPKLHRPIL